MRHSIRTQTWVPRCFRGHQYVRFEEVTVDRCFCSPKARAEIDDRDSSYTMSEPEYESDLQAIENNLRTSVRRRKALSPPGPSLRFETNRNCSLSSHNRFDVPDSTSSSSSKRWLQRDRRQLGWCSADTCNRRSCWPHRTAFVLSLNG